MKVVKVADMKVELVVGKVANMKVDTVANMKVDKVADMKVDMVYLWNPYSDFLPCTVYVYCTPSRNWKELAAQSINHLFHSAANIMTS